MRRSPSTGGEGREREWQQARSSQTGTPHRSPVCRTEPSRNDASPQSLCAAAAFGSWMCARVRAREGSRNRRRARTRLDRQQHGRDHRGGEDDALAQVEHGQAVLGLDTGSLLAHAGCAGRQDENVGFMGQRGQAGAGVASTVCRVPLPPPSKTSCLSQAAPPKSRTQPSAPPDNWP